MNNYNKDRERDMTENLQDSSIFKSLSEEWRKSKRNFIPEFHFSTAKLDRRGKMEEQEQDMSLLFTTLCY